MNDETTINEGDKVEENTATFAGSQLPATQESEPQPPTMHQANPFEEVGRLAQRRIVGQLLICAQGDWLYGAEKEELPVGTRLIANMDQLAWGWVRWEDSKPVEQAMGLVGEAFKPAKREELGFDDKEQWECDEKTGEPRDPWQFTYYLAARQIGDDKKPMTGKDGLYTFATSSRGGDDAIKELCASYGKWMAIKPEHFPIVRLAVDKYKHKNPKYGIIKKPVFEFNPKLKNNWASKTDFGEIVEVPDGEELEEDIPF
jgi:hypothetical protein